MDVARTAVRFSAAKVSLVYRRTMSEMPAAAEYQEAHEEGVIFRFLEAPIKIEGEQQATGLRIQKMALGEADASGRRSPIALEGQEDTIPADIIVKAIGQALDISGLESELPLNSWGAIDVDEDSFCINTNLSGVYAIGDAINKGGTAIEAIAHANQAVPIIHSYLLGSKYVKPSQMLVKDVKTVEDFASEPKEKRQTPAQLSPTERIRSFAEVSQSLTEDQAQMEAKRCLSCGCGEYSKCKLLEYSRQYEADPNAYKAPLKTKFPQEKMQSHPNFAHDPNKCILCGLCVRACEELAEQGVISMSHRGYVSTVAAALGEPISKAACPSGCDHCAKLCPTGALESK